MAFELDLTGAELGIVSGIAMAVKDALGAFLQAVELNAAQYTSSED